MQILEIRSRTIKQVLFKLKIGFWMKKQNQINVCHKELHLFGLPFAVSCGSQVAKLHEPQLKFGRTICTWAWVKMFLRLRWLVSGTQWYFSMKLVKKIFWIFLSCGNLLSVILYQNALKSSLLVYKWYKNHIMSFKVGLC